MEKVNWDELKEKLAMAVKLEKSDDDLLIKINILETNLEETGMVGKMLTSEEEMKQSLGQFLGKKGSIECDVKINQDERYVMIIFKRKKDFKKTYNLLNDMFFGNFFKEMIEAMMDAFKQFRPD